MSEIIFTDDYYLFEPKNSSSMPLNMDDLLPEYLSIFKDDVLPQTPENTLEVFKRIIQNKEWETNEQNGERETNEQDGERETIEQNQERETIEQDEEMETIEQEKIRIKKGRNLLSALKSRQKKKERMVLLEEIIICLEIEKKSLEIEVCALQTELSTNKIYLAKTINLAKRFGFKEPIFPKK